MSFQSQVRERLAAAGEDQELAEHVEVKANNEVWILQEVYERLSTDDEWNDYENDGPFPVRVTELLLGHEWSKFTIMMY